MGVNLEVRGGVEFRNELAALSVRALRGSEIATREGADLIRQSIQENMHGPLPPKAPGADPAMRTGNLFASVKMRALAGSLGEGRWTYEIYMDTTQARYARRIELGFSGTDARGRNYAQPPYPYFFKGVDTAIGAGIIDDLFFRTFEAELH